MGFEEILSGINSRTESELAAIEESNSREISEIEKHAAEQAEEYASASKARAAAESSRIIASETSKANIDAKHIIDEATMERLSQALNYITDNLKDYAKTDGYAKLLSVIADKARGELGECTIYVQKQDLKAVPGSQQANEKFIGGIKAVSKDGSKEVDYTLESIFSTLKQKVSYALVKKLKVGR